MKAVGTRVIPQNATTISASAIATMSKLRSTMRWIGPRSGARPRHRRVESAIEDVAPFRRHRGPQPQGALRRLKRHSVDRADEGGRGDDERELLVHLAGQARQKAAGRNTDISTSVMPMIGPNSSLIAFTARFAAGHACLDMTRHALHDDDGVVHDDADREHEGEQRGAG